MRVGEHVRLKGGGACQDTDGEHVRLQVGEHVRLQVGEHVRLQVGEHVRLKVGELVKLQVGDQVGWKSQSLYSSCTWFVSLLLNCFR